MDIDILREKYSSVLKEYSNLTKHTPSTIDLLRDRIAQLANDHVSLLPDNLAVAKYALSDKVETLYQLSCSEKIIDAINTISEYYDDCGEPCPVSESLSAALPIAEKAKRKKLSFGDTISLISLLLSILIGLHSIVSEKNNQEIEYRKREIELLEEICDNQKYFIENQLHLNDSLDGIADALQNIYDLLEDSNNFFGVVVQQDQDSVDSIDPSVDTEDCEPVE